MKSESTVVTHQNFAYNDKRFQVACRIAKTEPTRRQASKFRRGFGLAQEGMKDFIARGHAEARERLEADLAKLEQDLKAVADDPEAEDTITNLKGAIEIVKSDIAHLDSDLKILRGQ